MVRMAEVLTLRVTHSPVSGMKNFFGLEVWVETTFRLPVGVRYVVTRDGLFAREVTYFWHN